VNRPPAGGRAPWDTGDLVRLIAVVPVGAVVCAVAWTGASGHAELRDQTGWVAVGVVGFLVIAAFLVIIFIPHLPMRDRAAMIAAMKKPEDAEQVLAGEAHL